MFRRVGSDYFNPDEAASRILAANPGMARSAANSAAWYEGKRLLEKAIANNYDFAFETTLATRSYVPWLTELKEEGYVIDIIFLWLSSPEMAIARVAERVRLGGHDVDSDVVRRRFARGLQNFFGRYRTLADRWWFFDNAGVAGPRLLAGGGSATTTEILDPPTWQSLVEHYR